MRRRYVWDKTTQKMVLKAEGETRKQMHYVQSFVPFSPTSDPNVVLSSSRDIKDYEKRTGLVQMADYKDEDFLPPDVEKTREARLKETLNMTEEIYRAYSNYDTQHLHEKILEAVDEGRL